jgi:hypothetical protein
VPPLDERPGGEDEPHRRGGHGEGLPLRGRGGPPRGGPLRTRPGLLVRAYSFAEHPDAPRWRTPFRATCDAWAKDPATFKINPHHRIPGPNT